MPSVASATQVEIYTKMTRIYQCDERFRSMLMSGKIALIYYSARGQEAIPAAVSTHLTDDDYVVTTYRGMHDTLAKGTSYKALWAEYLGRVDGTCRGKGGPMHVTDPEHGVMVTTGVVGSGLPIANGLALSSQLKGNDRVTVVNFGDGATNIGAFHEALNLAALWKLPVIFVCQNNEYGEHTKRENHQLVERISMRADSYGMPGVTVDGNDPCAVWQVAGEAIARARSGGGPTLIDAVTYRFMGHFFGDVSAAYMPEIVQRLAADPLPAFRAKLISEGHATEDALAAIEQAFEAELDEAIEFAMASPFPDISELGIDVYAKPLTLAGSV